MNERSGAQPSNEYGLAHVPGRPKVDVPSARAASAAVRDVPHNAKDAPPRYRTTTRNSNTSRSRAGGEQCFNRLFAVQKRVYDEAADQPSDIDDDFDDEDSCFTTKTVDSSDELNLYGNPEDRPGEDEVLLSSEGGTKDGAASEDPPVQNFPGDVSEEAEENATAVTTVALAAGGGSLQASSDTFPPPLKGRSMAHHLLTQKKMVFVSLDLETGGEICGIIQLSAEIVRVELKRGG